MHPLSKATHSLSSSMGATLALVSLVASSGCAPVVVDHHFALQIEARVEDNLAFRKEGFREESHSFLVKDLPMNEGAYMLDSRVVLVRAPHAMGAHDRLVADEAHARQRP